MRIAGLFIATAGFLLSLTIIGALIGIPLMILGVVMMVFGGRRKTIINNVVTVQNAPGHHPTAPSAGSSTPQLTNSEMPQLGASASAPANSKLEM